MHPDGEAMTMTKRRQLRDEDILIDRDLDILIKLRQGREKKNLARAYRITKRQINGRLADIPEEVKAAVNRLVDECAADGLHYVPDAALDGIRRAMATRKTARTRRVARDVGRLQTA
jgi:hypothetical protein